MIHCRAKKKDKYTVRHHGEIGKRPLEKGILESMQAKRKRISCLFFSSSRKIKRRDVRRMRRKGHDESGIYVGYTVGAIYDEKRK